MQCLLTTSPMLGARKGISSVYWYICHIATKIWNTRMPGPCENAIANDDRSSSVILGVQWPSISCLFRVDLLCMKKNLLLASCRHRMRHSRRAAVSCFNVRGCRSVVCWFTYCRYITLYITFGG